MAAVHDRGRRATVLDANKDGLSDLAVSSLGSTLYFSPNRLFLNRGGRFEEVVNTPLRREAGSECVASFKRQDGNPDLFFGTKPQQAGDPGVLTYRNNGGIYREITSSTPYRQLKPQHVEFADLNGDRRPDLVIVTFTKLSI